MCKKGYIWWIWP